MRPNLIVILIIFLTSITKSFSQNLSETQLKDIIANADKAYEEEDYETSFDYFMEAANYDNPYALFKVGRFYDYGEGVPQDYEKAINWYEKAIEKGSASAMNNMGSKYLNGEGVPENDYKARELFERAAALGNDFALSNLGVIYNNGYGVEKDKEKAIAYYEQAVEKGNINAMINLGDIYEKNDVDKALSLFETAAAKNSGTAYCRIGDLYFYEHLTNNQRLGREKSRTYYEKAAELDNARGQFMAGFIYLQGYGVNIDKDKALDYFMPAAFKEHTQAMIYAANMIFNKIPWNASERELKYGQGLVMPHDFYKKAADKGDADGLFNMGDWYFYDYLNNGKILEENLSIALDYFVKAEQAKHSKALGMINLIEQIQEGKTELIKNELVSHFKGGNWYNYVKLVLEEKITETLSPTKNNVYIDQYGLNRFNINDNLLDVVIEARQLGSMVSQNKLRHIYLPYKNLYINTSGQLPVFNYKGMTPSIKMKVKITSEYDEEGSYHDEEFKSLNELFLFSPEIPYFKIVCVNRLINILSSLDY